MESYNATLYECMGLTSKAETVGRMLERLERASSAELTAIESVERRADGDRQLRWTVAIGFISTIAVPITLILAFLGINAREVDSQRSMFDAHYVPMYLFTGTLLVTGALLSTRLYVKRRRRAREDSVRLVLPRWGFDADADAT